MDYVKAFVVGGIICVIGQILIDKTKLTPARILVTFVMAGAFLQLFGLYKPLVDFAGYFLIYDRKARFPCIRSRFRRYERPAF